MPGARIRWIVTMKFSPVKDRAEAGDEDRRRRGHDVGVEVVGRKRRGEGPSGINATEHERSQRQGATDDVQVPAQKVDLRERQIASPRS